MAESLGNRIKKIRESLGKTQEDFGKLFGVTKMTVSHWEIGRRDPNIETLVSIIKIGEVSLDWLLLGEKSEEEDKSIIMIQLREKIKELEQKIAEQKIFINMVAEKAPEYLTEKKKGRKKK